MTCVAALSNACAVASPDDGGFQEGSVSDDLSDYSKERDLQLIGGTQAAPYHFRSTVQLRFPGIGACTGAKVGPRHFLTAAHCIADDAGQSQLGSGDSIEVTNDIVLAGATFQSLPVQSATVHETYTDACDGDCVNGRVMHWDSPADIAVIVVGSDSPSIPAARVDLGHVPDGTSVVKTGYGCEDNVNSGSPSARYKTDVTETVSSNDLISWGWWESSFVRYRVLSEDLADRIGATNLVTHGNSGNSTEASLCPGDSGGPLYLNNNSDPRVIAVNAYYVFSTFGSVSARDVHTRTSTRSRHNIGAWLYDLGVNTVGGDRHEGSGAISVERWEDVPGNRTIDIPVDQPPDITWQAPSFELTTVDWGDNYGVRMRGYLTAPTSGEYNFWISGDDWVRLYLSSNTNSANKDLIAFHNDWTGYREWNKHSSQRSQPIQLVAGQVYYIEALMKEGGGGDHLSVGWTQPGEVGDYPFQIIPGTQLSALDPLRECTCDVGCNSLKHASDPLTIDGRDDNCYFFHGDMGAYLWSDQMTEVNVNGQDFTNVYQYYGGYPSQVDGGYYLYLKSNSPFSMTEVN